MSLSSDFIRCPNCGSKVYGMQVHNMETCEKIQKSRGLLPPWPFKKWPDEPDDKDKKQCWISIKD